MVKKIVTVEELFKEFGFVAIFKDPKGNIYGSNSVPVKTNGYWKDSEFETLLSELFNILDLENVDWGNSLRYGLIEPTKENFKLDAKVFVRSSNTDRWIKGHLASFEPGEAEPFGIWNAGVTSFTIQDPEDVYYYQYCKFASEELT